MRTSTALLLIATLASTSLALPVPRDQDAALASRSPPGGPAQTQTSKPPTPETGAVSSRSLDEETELNERAMELEERGWEELDPRDLDEFQYSLDERGVPNTGLPNNPGIQQSANTVNNNQPQQIQQRSLEDIDDEIDLYARSMPEEELDFEPFSARSVPEDELEWTVDMRDVEGEENLAERNKVGQAMGKAFNII